MAVQPGGATTMQLLHDYDERDLFGVGFPLLGAYPTPGTVGRATRGAPSLHRPSRGMGGSLRRRTPGAWAAENIVWSDVPDELRPLRDAEAVDLLAAPAPPRAVSAGRRHPFAP